MKNSLTKLSLSIICLLPCAGFAQNMMTNKPHINHTAIYVVQLQPALNFYAKIIGLDTIANPFNDGKHAWLKTGEHTAMHIIEGAPERKEYYKNQHTCFSVPDMQTFLAKLQLASIPYEDVAGNLNKVTTRIDGVLQIWLQDPDGYWVEINNARD